MRILYKSESTLNVDGVEVAKAKFELDGDAVALIQRLGDLKEEVAKISMKEVIARIVGGILAQVDNGGEGNQQ